MPSNAIKIAINNGNYQTLTRTTKYSIESSFSIFYNIFISRDFYFIIFNCLFKPSSHIYNYFYIVFLCLTYISFSYSPLIVSILVYGFYFIFYYIHSVDYVVIIMIYIYIYIYVIYINSWLNKLTSSSLHVVNICNVTCRYEVSIRINFINSYFESQCNTH